jgi:hypothetical protein
LARADQSLSEFGKRAFQFASRPGAAGTAILLEQSHCLSEGR